MVGPPTKSSPSSSAKDHPWEYLLASAMAACLNYPLWRASAMTQSGFAISNSATAARSVIQLPSALSPYAYAFCPPYKGMVATVGGMTWARAAIFWGSDRGREWLRAGGEGWSDSVALVVPPLVVSTLVQCINMPLVRASVMLQNPKVAPSLQNTWHSLQFIYHHHGGMYGLWHGTSAGILKTVPKYITAVVVKECAEERLPRPIIWNNCDDEGVLTYHDQLLLRSAVKSVAAGVAGAALTNPLDVIRNDMFQRNTSLIRTCQLLHSELGWPFCTRGLGHNLVAVAIPLACTIFFTDLLISFNNNNNNNDGPCQL